MKNKLFITSVLVGMLLSFSACDDYLDINFDPSNPQVAEGFAVLPPILSQMARGESFDTRYIGSYTQNWARNTSNYATDLHGYFSGSDALGDIWRSHYWSIGKNVDLIIAEATKKEQWDYIGVSQAIRAWSWQTLTDYHGEVILKQAWEPNRYVFDYDSQEEVYAEVQRLSNLALENLNKTDGGVSQASLARGDLVYKGDRSKWTKFVYAVLARNANHLSNKSSYNPAKVIEYCDKSLASNDDNFGIPHAGTSSSDGNFYGPTRQNVQVFRPTNFFVNLLNGTVFNGVQDPRISLMITASPDGVYRGVDPGKGDPTNTTANTNTTRIPTFWGNSPAVTNVAQITGKYIFTDKANHFIFTYPEIQFIKAEAAFKKGDKALAYDAFKKGIIAHMDFTKVPAAQRDAYLASAAVPQSADALTISDIMLQKYIAMWVLGCIETWVDMRRYDYSSAVYKGFAFPTAFYIDNNGKPVYRVRPRYNSEYVWNLESLAKLGGDKADYHTVKPWFMLP